MNDELNPLESERLRRLLDAVAELPREVAPPENGWQAIRQRIDAGRVRTIAPGADAVANRRYGRWWPAAAAAAAAAVLLAVGLFATMRARDTSARRELAGPGPASAPASAPASSPVTAPVPLPAPVDSHVPPGTARAVARTPVALTRANPALAAVIDQYQAASRELEAAVAARTAELPPATRDVVRRSLATIDSALTDLRIALGQDPANAALGQYLTAVYEQKLDFLKRVRALPGAGM